MHMRQLPLSVCCLSSVCPVKKNQNLEIYRIKQLLNPTISLKSKKKMYVIVAKAVLFSAFPALSYLTSVGSRHF